MMEGSQGEAVLLRLFDSDLDEALQLVFLSLDPESLKASRLVCKAWDTFIKRRVWGITPGSQWVPGLAS